MGSDVPAQTNSEHIGPTLGTVGRAQAYDRHTGRYAPQLAPAFARFAGVTPGMRVLDVGCGPGALASELASIVGADRVAAADPLTDYVEACRARVPGAAVRVASAERLPFAVGSFDAVLAQLVIQVLSDAPQAVREFRRVAVSGGVVATCVWDFRHGMPLLDAYWGAARAVDPKGARRAGGDAENPWCTADGLAELWTLAGLDAVETSELRATARYQDFDDAWWSFSAGVSPSGAYCRSLPAEQRAALRDEFRRRLGSPTQPFELNARAWAVRGVAP